MFDLLKYSHAGMWFRYIWKDYNCHTCNLTYTGITFYVIWMTAATIVFESFILLCYAFSFIVTVIVLMFCSIVYAIYGITVRSTKDTGPSWSKLAGLLLEGGASTFNYFLPKPEFWGGRDPS